MQFIKSIYLYYTTLNIDLHKWLSDPTAWGSYLSHLRSREDGNPEKLSENKYWQKHFKSHK